MKVGDLVEYGPNLGPQWKKKGMGIVLEVGACEHVQGFARAQGYIKAVFPAEKDERWFHCDNLEVISESR